MISRSFVLVTTMHAYSRGWWRVGRNDNMTICGMTTAASDAKLKLFSVPRLHDFFFQLRFLLLIETAASRCNIVESIMKSNCVR